MEKNFIINHKFFFNKYINKILLIYMFKLTNYSDYIAKWNSLFVSKLNENKNECISFYILNKLFLEIIERRGQFNKNLLKENNVINPEKNFYIIDQKIWLTIKRNYPTEKELKVEGILNNKKCVLEFDKCLYYFYFLNTNQNILEEGYMEFDNQENAQIIKAKFFELEINDFFQKMKIKRQANEKQVICYQNQDKIIKFFFKLKQDKDIKNNNNYVFLKNNEARGNRFNQNYNNNNKKGINFQKMAYINNINYVNNFNKNNNYNNNPCKIENYNPSFIRDEESFKISLKIYRCIYYYYEFKQNLKKINEAKKQKLFLINKFWLKEFKNKFKYKEIKKILNQENQKLKDCNNIIKELAEKYTLALNKFYIKDKWVIFNDKIKN